MPERVKKKRGDRDVKHEKNEHLGGGEDLIGHGLFQIGGGIRPKLYSDKGWADGKGKERNGIASTDKLTLGGFKLSLK